MGRFLDRVCRVFGRGPEATQALILIGIGYDSHALSAALHAGQCYRVIACIDEEPWNHRTLLNGARVHYPSELVALAEKHAVVAVIAFAGEGWLPDGETLAQLAALEVPLLTLATATPVDQAVAEIEKARLGPF